MSKYLPERIWPRVVPKGSVTVSVYLPKRDQAYGVLSDVSERGASFVAGVLFEAKSEVLLRIGFDPEAPFSTPAEVVWTRDESDSGHEPSYIHGVRFRIEDPDQLERLRGFLRSREAPPAAAPGLSGLVRELARELVDLGDRIQNES